MKEHDWSDDVWTAEMGEWLMAWVELVIERHNGYFLGGALQCSQPSVLSSDLTVRRFNETARNQNAIDNCHQEQMQLLFPLSVLL